MTALTHTDSLRLQLRARDTRSRVDRFVDGGWWPQSSDLAAELGPLLAAVEAAGHDPIRRVTFNLDSWDRTPSRNVVIGGRMVKLGGFHNQDPSMITLIGSSGTNNMDLVVIAPDTDPEVAERAFALASREGDKHRAPQIMAMAADPSLPSVDAGS